MPLVLANFRVPVDAYAAHSWLLGGIQLSSFVSGALTLLMLCLK